MEIELVKGGLQILYIYRIVVTWLVLLLDILANLVKNQM